MENDDKNDVTDGDYSSVGVCDWYGTVTGYKVVMIILIRWLEAD